jgi:hypothetical protein
MSASPDTLGTSDAVRAELEALLGISDAALAGGVAALQDVLRDRENPEELARREMLDLVSTTAGVPFGAAADLIDPCISVELCVERGWPVRCFTACNCTGRCMKRLAIQDGGVFDELLQRLRDAHTRAEAGTDVPRAKRAQQILQGSVWRHTIEGVASPMLEALLADERAAAMEAEARASTGSVEATIVAVNAALQQRGCCKQGRLAFVGCSSDYLSYDRKRGSAGPRVCAWWLGELMWGAGGAWYSIWCVQHACKLSFTLPPMEASQRGGSSQRRGSVGRRAHGLGSRAGLVLSVCNPKCQHPIPSTCK